MMAALLVGATVRCESAPAVRHPASLQVRGIIPKGNLMAFKSNYGMQRADRNRAAQAQSEQKQRKRDEKSAQRKAERASEISSPPGDKKAQ